MLDLSLNRSFKYGDGIFESLRVIDHKVVFLREHVERLEKSFEILGFEQPINFSAQWLEKEILNHLASDMIDANPQNWRVRISFWRNAEGLYFPENNRVSWSIESSLLDSKFYQLNENGFKIGIYNDVKISTDILSGIKSCSALPYVMTAIHKNKMGWNEALVLNTNDRIAESSSSNIFVLKANTLFTPSEAEGPILGICRRLILETASEIGLTVMETQLDRKDLIEADEIWLTNIIWGIRWVSNVAGFDLTLGADQAKKMTALLNKKALSIH